MAPSVVIIAVPGSFRVEILNKRVQDEGWICPPDNDELTLKTLVM